MNAQEYNWSLLGPPAGDINAMAIHPSNNSVIYTGTNSGLYLSNEEGSIWSFQNNFPAIEITDIVIETEYNYNIYIATKDSGIYISNDEGTTWSEINNSLPQKDINKLAHYPINKDSTVIFANSLSSGVYRSLDSGANWNFIGFKGLDVTSILFNPTDYAIVYISTVEEGIFKSTDVGDTWITKNNGIVTSNINNYDIYTITINPKDPNMLYTGGSGFLNTNSIYVSYNGGENWININSEFLIVNSIVISPIKPEVIYAGTYQKGILKSENGGVTWSSINNIETFKSDYIPSISIIAIMPTTPDTLLMGILNEGIFKTNDGGLNWVSSSIGISNGHSYVLEIDEQRPEIIYTSSRINLWKSSDNGFSWKNIKQFSVNTLAIHPFNSNIIFAGTSNQIGTGNIMKSEDGGNNWALAFQAPSSITSIKIDPEFGEIIYAGYGRNNQVEGGILKSINGGENWENIYLGDVGVAEILIDPKKYNKIFAGTDKGIFFSNNYGSNWIHLSLYTDFIWKISIDPKNSDVLYVSTNNGLKKSMDGGNSWFLICNELEGEVISDILIDKINTNRIFISTFGKGIYYSNDGGGNWLDLNKGLINLFINSIRFHPLNNKIIYASSNGAGVLKAIIDDLTATLPSNNKYYLSQNHPNPFVSKTFITYKIKNNAHDNSPVYIKRNVKLTVYNSLGQRIKSFINLYSKPGEYTIEWDSSNDFGKKVSNGIYFCELKIGGTVRAIKMLKLNH